MKKYGDLIIIAVIMVMLWLGIVTILSPAETTSQTTEVKGTYDYHNRHIRLLEEQNQLLREIRDEMRKNQVWYNKK